MISLPPHTHALIWDNTQALAISADDGEVKPITSSFMLEAFATENPCLVCHMPQLANRAQIKNFVAFDLLELFAFVRPAQFCVPTPTGLAQALGLIPAKNNAGLATQFFNMAELLLAEAAKIPATLHQSILAILQASVQQKPAWVWAPYIAAAMGLVLDQNREHFATDHLRVWQDLPKWESTPPRGEPRQADISTDAALQQLQQLLQHIVPQHKDRLLEQRPQQVAYTAGLTHAFAAHKADVPQIVLAEAGTGVGKTLGYLAPALTWAMQNDGAVWVTTFTKQLQNQIAADLKNIFPKDTDGNPFVIRKGRENYACLLNIAESMGLFLTGEYPTRVGLTLLLRWLQHTTDGDLLSGDLPGWLQSVVGPRPTTMMTDKRGECLFVACPHYQRCFIERAQKQSQQAMVVVGNHALTLHQLAQQSDVDADPTRALPTRLVFDEAHHVFDVADDVFSAELTGLSFNELRRWLFGPPKNTNSSRKPRRQGLKRRLENHVPEHNALWQTVEHALNEARFLPEAGWLERITNQKTDNNVAETFLAAVAQHVLKNQITTDNNIYDLEAPFENIGEDIQQAATQLSASVQSLLQALNRLVIDLQQYHDQLPDDPLTLDTRQQIKLVQRQLRLRALGPTQQWLGMLSALTDPTQKPHDAVMWLSLSRIDGRMYNTGAHAHALDPTQPLAALWQHQTHSVTFTSATLKPRSGDAEKDWQRTNLQFGLHHLAQQTQDDVWRLDVPSPFNYATQTRIFVVQDMPKNDPALLGAAYGALFQAANGGALGLLTAIQRLKQIYPTIAKFCRAKNLPLYAQHIDAMPTNTLVDIFKAEPDACLLGTDALRDGVDVPGNALRLVVLDRIPWPRASILHKARRAFYKDKLVGGLSYDHAITQQRLRQAFGRLIRTNTDRGVFVLLDGALPSLLERAFPENVVVERVPLSVAIAQTAEFLL